MAYELRVACLGTQVAAADLSGNQFRPVSINSAGKAALVTTAVAIDGVLQNKPEADEPADVMFVGLTKALIGTGGATAGALAAPTTDGMIDATTGQVASGRWVVGGSAGEYGVLLLGSPGAGSAAP